MRRRKPSSELNDKSATKTSRTVVLNNGRPYVPSVEFASFPAPISRLVGGYLPVDERSYVETAFAGVQPISLCLSQDVGSNLASSWPIGFLPPNLQWEPSNVKIDKEYLIQDYEGCLQLLKQEDSSYCRVAIEVLVVKLSRTSNDFPSALKDLRYTIEALNRHLSSVKHVVISMEEYASFCFTLNDAIGNANQGRQSVDQLKAIFQIIDDLYTYCCDNPMLTPHRLFDFYFNSEAKPASEKYLAKFVVPLNTRLNQSLFDDEASKMLSTKIMWVCSWNSQFEITHCDQNTTRLCHALHLNMVGGNDPALQLLHDRVLEALNLEDNRFIERIVIDSGSRACNLQLPRPGASLIDATPFSALIEISLKGEKNSFDLTQLNNGYFPHLVHLSIIGGKMTGCLDSQSVPRLKTLSIKLGGKASSLRLIRKRAQAIVDTRHPWQLVASQDDNGWSLASYDDSTANPHDDGREDSPPSLPVIRELMIVIYGRKHADEWESLLNSDPPRKAAAAAVAQNISFKPDRVKKITAFGVPVFPPILRLKACIPAQARILASLVCHDIALEVEDGALPHLQSLEVKRGSVKLSGAFPQLKTLSFQETRLRVPWEVNASLLESLSCLKLRPGDLLSLRPESLPLLSCLRIELWEANPKQCPKIIVNKNSFGLSLVKHVVFGRRMMLSPYFHQWQVHKAWHFELTVNLLQPPAGWEFIVWQCETMTLHFYEAPVEYSDSDESDDESAPEKKPSVFTLSLKLPFVKKLTVTESNCHVLLNSVMPKLTDCIVPSPESLGKNLKCPSLEFISFTNELSPIEKEVCLNPATYEAIGARPRWIYFGDSGEANRMLWDVDPSATGVST